MVAFVVPNLFDWRFAETVFFANEANHFFIEVGEVAIVQLFAVDQ